MPDTNTITIIDRVLNTSLAIPIQTILEDHPKLNSLNYKREMLLIDNRLKANNILPIVDLGYNFLSSDLDTASSLNIDNYKSNVTIRFPLFLRKERGDLRLSKLRLQDVDFEISAKQAILRNKIEAIRQQIDSYEIQYDILGNLVKDYKRLVYSEQRKFNLGEGSLFLVNYREAKLIESQLKQIKSAYELFRSRAMLLAILNGLN